MVFCFSFTTTKCEKPNYGSVRKWFTLSARRITYLNTVLKYYVNDKTGVAIKPYATLHLPGSVIVLVTLQNTRKELVEP